mmetsp:Transcript_19862/g.45922  ORF Transcript_19862/g.45922 Transcript_19862/m.45922 type:complete len:138 (-) Transcript_19862:143-556(-)
MPSLADLFSQCCAGKGEGSLTGTANVLIDHNGEYSSGAIATSPFQHDVEPGDNQYRVTLSKQGRRLGVAIGYFKDDMNAAIVTKIVEGGAVEVWNAKNPGKAVREGYKIRAANGKVNALEICEEARSKDYLELIVEP